MIILEIKTLHYKLTGVNMPIYGVHNRFLKDFVTSKSDRKKNKFKIPEEQFRLREEDFKVEKPITTGSDLINCNVKESKNLYQKTKEAGAASLEDFTVISMLGKGSVGKVFLVQKKQTKKYYAMKVLRKDILIDTDLIENTRIEKEILKRVNI
jgi:hypothetical protein